MNALDLAERGLLPDIMIRFGIRRLCRHRLASLRNDGTDSASAIQDRLLRELHSSPVAIDVDAANAQHYELPPPFFQRCLGPQLKYSACLFERPGSTLAEAEEAMLALYAERAELSDGQRILELGCGWGSLTLWLAARFPNSRVTGVSNSANQRAFILARARERGLSNIDIVTCDVNHLELPAAAFDRVISIEMFEHLRNYATMLRRIAAWLVPGGALFVHIFCHREWAYPFQTHGSDNWMGRHFFTGGLMPAFSTLMAFQDDLRLAQAWRLGGHHYQRTAEAWLANHDREQASVTPIMRACYGLDEAALWNQRWRMFWMACAETFGYRNGEEWMVGHYLFRKPG